MGRDVSHAGRVLEVTPECVKVEIISSSACSTCHAAGLCSMAEAVRKVVEVPASVNQDYMPGDEVEVVLAASMGLKAAVIAYVVPLAILLVLCVSLSYSGVHEVWAGLAGLAGVAVYYLAVWRMRDRLADEYVFTIRRKNNLNS